MTREDRARKIEQLLKASQARGQGPHGRTIHAVMEQVRAIMLPRIIRIPNPKAQQEVQG
jgi:hypothetical protein